MSDPLTTAVNLIGEREYVSCYGCEGEMEFEFWELEMTVMLCPICGEPREISDVISEYREG